jgi:hypothetical protein
MAFALWQLGKEARLVNHDAPPTPMMVFPGVPKIEVASRIEDPGDAVIVMECGELSRTGVEGFERGFVINIDHHLGNTGYGTLNWFDTSAAACGEMVFDLVRELGVELTRKSRRMCTSRSSPTPGRFTTRTFPLGPSTSAASASRPVSIRPGSQGRSTTATRSDA